MKKVIILLIFFSISNISYVFSQTGWILQNSGQSVALNSAYLLNSNTAWVTGENNVILKTTNAGTNWFLQSPINPVGTINDIYFFDAQTGFAVGTQGAIIKTTDGGLNWISLNSNPAYDLSSLSFIDINTGYVTGGNFYDHTPVFLKTTNSGIVWTMTTLPFNTYMYSIQATENNTIYICGGHPIAAQNETGAILKSTNGGNNFSILYTRNQILYSLSFINASTGILGCDYTPSNSVIYRTSNGGTTWISQGDDNDMFSVQMVDSSVSYRAGSQGFIYRTSDAGASWNSITPYGSQHIFDITFFNAYTGYTVGVNGRILRTETAGYGIPGVPSKVVPRNDTIMNNFNFYFLWLSAAGAQTYRIQISIDSLFNTNIIDSSGISSTGYHPPSNVFSANINYYWRVNASNNSGTGPWSSIWKFRISTSNIPLLASPLNGDTGMCSNQKLIWYKAKYGTAYNINVSVDSGFGNSINISNCTDTSTFLPSFSLQPGTTYFWRVNSSNPAGLSQWSGIRHFRTGYLKPQLTYPQNNDTGVSRHPVFIWQEYPNASQYVLQVSQNNNFAYPEINVTVTGTSYQYQYFLQRFKNYYWRVGAIYSMNTSFWSNINTFRTNDSNLINIKLIGESIPTTYNLYQNYPNPFNPVTIIKFDLPNSSIMNIKIFNISGKEISTVLNKRLDAGTYEFNWDAAQYPSGVYFYRLTAGDFTSVKKMILIK